MPRSNQDIVNGSLQELIYQAHVYIFSAPQKMLREVHILLSSVKRDHLYLLVTSELGQARYTIRKVSVKLLHCAQLGHSHSERAW